MSLLAVNGTVLPDPSTYNITKADLDSENSYTSETGALVRDVILFNHVTIDVEWEHLTREQIQTINSLLNNEQKSFTLHYYDYYTGQVENKEFYVYNRQGKGIRVKRYANTGYEHYSVSTQLIQCSGNE